MSEPYLFPRTPARLSFNGGPEIEGEIMDMKLGGYATQPRSFSAITEIVLDPVNFDALQEYQQRLAKEAKVRQEAHERETLGFRSSVVSESFKYDLTFENLMWTAGRLRPLCCGITCSPTSYEGMKRGIERLENGMTFRAVGSGGMFCNGIELFEVRTQKETALAWYDDKAMREYLKANP